MKKKNDKNDFEKSSHFEGGGVQGQFGKSSQFFFFLPFPKTKFFDDILVVAKFEFIIEVVLRSTGVQQKINARVQEFKSTRVQEPVGTKEVQEAWRGVGALDGGGGRKGGHKEEEGGRGPRPRRSCDWLRERENL